MIDLKSRPGSLSLNFGLVRDLLRTFGPDSLDEIRHKSFVAFQQAGIPTQKHEEFKYLSLKVLDEDRFGPAYGATLTREQSRSASFGMEDAITIAFVNGEYSPELSSEQALPEGVFAGTLQEGFQFDEARILSQLGKAATLKGRLGASNDERFVNLNTAYLGEGCYILIPAGVSVERPIHISWICIEEHGAFACYPRNLIILGENAQAKIVESYVGLKGEVFANVVSEAFLGAGSNLELTKIQSETPESVHIATQAAWQEQTSTFTSNNVNFGGSVVRNDVNVWINGEHTETSLNGVSMAGDRQVVDNHTRIDHATPNCHSFETYKAIIGGHGVGVFNGKIFVYEDAQKTDAKQTNQALLMSPTATINTKPQLEIFADDVKCTHGATVGQLREDALFYLRSRGIPEVEASGLLVYAFAGEVLDKIGIQTVRETLERQLKERVEAFGRQVPQEVAAF